MQDFMQTWLDWAAQGQSFPAIEEAIDYLNTHAPKNEHSGLVWNDSRMGNTMFADDLSVAAFFDFEVSRSEEHTSELQSLMRNSYAVFCLKKKKNNDNIIKQTHKSTAKPRIKR